MCVIVHQPRGTHLEKDRAKRLWAANSHGGGFCYINDNQVIQVEKSMFFEDYWRKFERARSEFPERDFLLHMRIKTHGKVSLANTHPFYVSDQTVMMHNGILSQMPDHAEMSDSRVFIEKVLLDLPETWLDNRYLEDMVDGFIGWSKLAFMTTNPDLDHEVYLINEISGQWDDGMWFSSASGVAEPRPKADGRKDLSSRGGNWKKDPKGGWLEGKWIDGKWKALNHHTKEKAGTGATTKADGKEYRQTYLNPGTSTTTVLDDQGFDEWLTDSGIPLHESLPLSIIVGEKEMDQLWSSYLDKLRKDVGNKNYIMWKKQEQQWECLGCDEKVDNVTGECQCWNKLCLNCVRFTVECTCHKGYVDEPTWCDDSPDEAVSAAIQAYVDGDGLSTVTLAERVDDTTDTSEDKAALGPTNQQPPS